MEVALAFKRAQNKWFVFLVLIQVLFSMGFESLMGDGKKDLHPFFTWKIFHTRPDKVRYRGLIFIHSVDGVAYSPPIELLDAKASFPGMDFYSLSRRMNRLAWALKENATVEAAELIKELESAMLEKHRHVRYEVVLAKLNVIDYARSRTFLNREGLLLNEASR